MSEKEKNFVKWVIERAAQDNAFRARMARGDNEDTEDQCWEYLARYGVDLGRDEQRLPYQLVGAAICKAKPTNDGAIGLGAALAYCENPGPDSQEESPDTARLRRLLSCSTIEETCRILRPLLSLIEKKAPSRLSYASLLRDLKFFRTDSKAIKLRWARDFYNGKKLEDAQAEE